MVAGSHDKNCTIGDGDGGVVGVPVVLVLIMTTVVVENSTERQKQINTET